PFPQYPQWRFSYGFLIEVNYDEGPNACVQCHEHEQVGHVNDIATDNDVRTLVEVRFPGVVLESEIQGWAFLERFERGVSAFNSIEKPTAQDHRWVGVCFYQLVRDSEALDALYTAIEMHDEGARVNVAHLLPFLE